MATDAELDIKDGTQSLLVEYVELLYPSNSYSIYSVFGTTYSIEEPSEDLLQTLYPNVQPNTMDYYELLSHPPISVSNEERAINLMKR